MRNGFSAILLSGIFFAPIGSAAAFEKAAAVDNRALNTAQPDIALISVDALKEHVAILASDSFLGRASGGEAEQKTTDYIIQAFADAGLEPAIETTNGDDWRQSVPLVKREAVKGKLAISWSDGRTVNIPDSAVALIGVQPHLAFKQAPIVFIGYGIVDPRVGRDDLKSANIEGSIVLRLGGRPALYDKQKLTAPDSGARKALYTARGAVAEIVIHPIEPARFGGVKSGLQRGLVELQGVVQPQIAGFIRRDQAVQFFEGSSVLASKMVTQAESSDFQPQALTARGSVSARTKIFNFTSANVVGILKSTKPDADRNIVITAHWDGYGVCEPNSKTDKICNGAVDNASGVAALIEAARALKQVAPLQSDVIFIATTAEEHGLLGTEYYVQHPVRPLDETLAALNLDTVALRDKGSAITILGQGLTSLDPLVEQVAQRQGRLVTPNPAAQQFYTRSDHYAFAKKGVPAIMAMGFFSQENPENDLMDEYFEKYYHQPSDELTIIQSFEGAAEDTALLVGLAQKIDALEVAPQWKEGSGYQRVATDR